MKFTGERFIPTEQGRIRLEHYHRYATVLDIINEKDVLDLACGEGYGSFLMSKTARSVTGIDISDEAVRHASRNYKRSNLKFGRGSASALEVPDASFDVVVSFETIEHLAEQEEMIKEIRRVLRPDGFLIISSPNRPIYSEESGENNEFHIKELDFDEFDDLLRGEFPCVRFFGQRMLMGSVIQPLDGGQGTYKAWHDDGTDLIPRSGSLQEPVYFVAVAGANEAAIPDIGASIIYPAKLDLVKQYTSFAKWAKDLDRTVTERDEFINSLRVNVTDREELISGLKETISDRDHQISALNQTISDRDLQISALKETVSDRDRRISGLEQSVSDRDHQISGLRETVIIRDKQISDLQVNLSEQGREIAGLTGSLVQLNRKIVELEDETVRRGAWALGLQAELELERDRLQKERERFEEILSSNSWRLTWPLREVRHWIFEPTRQVKRYTKGSLRLVKRLYQASPLSNGTREEHRKLLAKHIPRLLTASDTRLNGYMNPIGCDQGPEYSEINGALPEIDTFSITPDNISIATSNDPLVSVIIPVYGKSDYTLNCLASIAASPPKVPFEIIVVDDDSPDRSAELLAKIPGIRLIKNDENKGFIRSCNSAAAESKGEYLYFLNNDTTVTSGWMDELVRTFREFPGTGLAGSKLIYPDGRLQEAGGIIWQDGSAWNFGRLEDPELPAYNYAREVDYCSGASIMVPRALFEELGGFDEHYLPAYCEDSDLALKIRDKGYRVIYQPLSTVVHYEGVTSGTDTHSGPKAYQIENTKKLFSRWRDRLIGHQPPGANVDSAKDRKAKYRALVLEHCTPTPNQDAGSVTVFNLLLLLREMGFQVTFIPEDNFLYLPRYTTDLQRIGVEVLYGPHITSVNQHLKEFGGRYDLAFLFRPDVVDRHIKSVRKYCASAKVLYYTHDLHFLRMEREALLFKDDEKLKLAGEMKVRELAGINACDASIVVSEQELKAIQSDLPSDKLHVFPLILDIPGTNVGFSDRQDIVFVGGFQHVPNIDSVLYFVSEVMPILRRDLPGVRFHVVGSKPPPEIKALAADDVKIVGFVDDLKPLLDQMRVSVAPVRYGAGVKGKIGTAMAAGLPVVATSVGAEGMSLTHGANVLVADDAEGLAAAVVRLYQDETLWNKISREGIEFADATWGAEPAWRSFAAILRELEFDIDPAHGQLSLYRPSEEEPAVTPPSTPEQTTRSQRVKDADSLNGHAQDYKDKLRKEIEIYKEQTVVHDLPEIFHYWSNKYLTPIFHEGGFASIEEFFSSELLKAKDSTKSETARFASIGSGNCDVEVAIAKRLIESGYNNFILECVEINPTMLERGRAAAAESNVIDNVRFVEADFNLWAAEQTYDAVIANQSLHHVTELEHLFDQIKKGLHSNGRLVISDIIGRNGHQRWPESLEIVNKFWSELPERYKFNSLLGRHEEQYINWDCSNEGFEGIRAQDILPLLLQRFQFETFIGFGSAIDIFVDRCFGHHFDPDSQWDREFIDRVHAEDEAGLKSGRLTPTHMLAVCVKKLAGTPFYSRGLDPVSSVRHGSEFRPRNDSAIASVSGIK